MVSPAGLASGGRRRDANLRFRVGAGALTLLHEAVVDERIKELALDAMLVSYESVITHRIHRNIYESPVPGALKVYDLPDLGRDGAPAGLDRRCRRSGRATSWS